MGCHAGDAESYDEFRDFFYPVVQAYHKVCRGAREPIATPALPLYCIRGSPHRTHRVA